MSERTILVRYDSGLIPDWSCTYEVRDGQRVPVLTVGDTPNLLVTLLRALVLGRGGSAE
jgi:hypothetical protein